MNPGLLILIGFGLGTAFTLVFVGLLGMVQAFKTPYLQIVKPS